MSFLRTMIFATASMLLVVNAPAQDPNVKHFEKDGLTFDYPAKWQITDKSSAQMQFIELGQGDVIIRIRTPREWLKTPEKEAHAKKLFQDQYVAEFTSQLENSGLHPKHSAATTQIGGGDAAGERVRAVLDGDPGGLDSYFRIMSDRLVNLSIFASDKDLVKAAPAWDMIRNSLKVELPPQPKAKPSPAKGKP